MTLKEILSKEVRPFLQTTPIDALETGCSFLWRKDFLPYLSTPNIYDEIVTDIFISIDKDDEHINKCKKKMIGKEVIFKSGESLTWMEVFYTANMKFNFFWLDSEEDEEHGFKEYELAMKLGIRPFVICIDDYGGEVSVKWKKSSAKLKKDADFYKEYKTPTGLIIGFYKQEE